MKLCGQRWWEMQQVNNFYPHPKFVPGCPNLSRPGIPLYAAVNPSRLLLHLRRPKYSTARPAAQPVAKNSPKSYPQRYLAWCGQDVMAQTKPHSQTHAVSVKDLKRLPYPKPYLICCAKTGSPNRYPSFCHFLYISQAGPILTHHCVHRHASLPAKVTICCRRVLGCHPLPGCVEEELGRT